MSIINENNRFVKDDPNNMRIVTYPMGKNSIVVDVGGFTGDWASRIFCLYQCNIAIYEPTEKLYKQCKNNFGNNNKISIYNYGLSNETKTIEFYGDGVDGSIYKNYNNNINKINVLKASTDFKNKYPLGINLLKLNVEGSEYDILPDIIENYSVRMIDHILVQFHVNVKDHEQKREDIRKLLNETHNEDWCYKNIWESWSLK
jgi:FkbM family methyltransferase